MIASFREMNYSIMTTIELTISRSTTQERTSKANSVLSSIRKSSTRNVHDKILKAFVT